MFGEAFAAELEGDRSGESAASSTSGINMTTFSHQWTVGGDEQENESKEICDVIFSKYVFNAVKRSFMSLDIFSPSSQELSPEGLEEMEKLSMWLKYQKASTSKTRLKKIVRQRVLPTVRPRLWQELSGGSKLMSRVPNLYQETCHKLFGRDDQAPENVTACSLANHDGFMSYYLTGEGVIRLRKILYVLSYLHPDVTFCPILQQVASIFLHFMEDVWCFACMSAMLSGSKHYFDQTHAQANASDSAFGICSMNILRKETKKLQFSVLDASERVTTSLFPEWLRMIFQFLDFPILVRLVDIFIVEGPKVFFRTGFLLVRLFYESSLNFERIGFPTSKDLVLAIGQFSEASRIEADEFLKAALKIKIKNRQINSTILKCSEEGKQKFSENETAHTFERMISFDVTNISNIISPKQWECVIGWLPARIQLLKPEIAFTTDTDGFSLKTLYLKSEEEEQTLIILKTETKEVFGAYLSMSLKERHSGKKSLKYFGTGETFLFSIEPVIEKFIWSDIDHIDGKMNDMVKRKSSFVFVDIKGPPRRKRRSLRMSRRRSSVKIHGLPKNFSLADLPTHNSYGGIPKNSSVVNLQSYSAKEESDKEIAHENSDISHGSSVMSPSNLPSVFSDSTPQSTAASAERLARKTNPARSSNDGARLVYQHSVSANEADVYPAINENDVDGTHRITQLADDLCLVEKRIEIDHEDGKRHPEHAEHVKHAPNDLFIAGSDKCFMVGGGGGNGIWLDENINHGRSEVCNTFHNRILTKGPNGDFICVRLEVFRFRDPAL